MRLTEREREGARRIFFSTICGTIVLKQVELSARDADLLIEGLAARAEDYQDGPPAEDAIDAQSDSETLAHCRDLTRRIREAFS